MSADRILPGRPRMGASALVATLTILLAGCGDQSPRAGDGTVAASEAAPISAAPASAPPADWSGPTTVARLIAAAQANHPTRAAIAAARAAAAAQTHQASAWANPELGLSYGRTRPRIDDLERDTPYGGSLSQRLSWWGARNARIEAARAKQSAAEAEAQVTQMILQADVRRAAIAYIVAHDTASQADDQANIAQELAAQTDLMVAAGAVDRATAARARLEATTTALYRDASRRDVGTALAVLRTWCDPALPDGLVITDALMTPPLDAAQIAIAAERHPRLVALAQASAAAEASLSAEQQARVPEVTVGVFAEREAEKDTYGLTLGVELPLWNQNHAGIALAEAERAQARATARSEHLRLQRDLVEAIGALQTAQGTAQALSEQAVPMAEEAIRLRTTAYQSGDASLADLLEARRAANAVRSDLREARRRAASAAVDLGLAVGDPGWGSAPQGATQP